MLSIDDLITLGRAANIIVRYAAPYVLPYLIEGFDALRSLSA